MSQGDTGGQSIGLGQNRVLYRAVFLEDGGSELKEVEYHTVDEALQSACRDLRAGYRPIGIWAPDRSLVHGAAEIRGYCGRDGA